VSRGVEAFLSAAERSILMSTWSIAGDRRPRRGWLLGARVVVDGGGAVDHALLECAEVEAFAGPHDQLAVEDAVAVQLGVECFVYVGELSVRSVPLRDTGGSCRGGGRRRTG